MKSHTPEAEVITQKLTLLRSPLVTDSEYSTDAHSTKRTTAPDLTLFGNRYEDDCPQFQKHEDASLLELFYDLFFAANYTVFCETQGVNSHERFKAYVGYFSVLWITWLVTSLYDVRFVTDSLFERAARGVHLGVMVGFAVVAPKFTPHDQDMRTMRTMSLILMVSRLCLTVEYASILWHIRKYKKQALPMLLQIGLNFVLAMIYLGVTFRFTNHNSNVFITWYVLAGVEVILTFVIAYVFPVLSFQGTHLMKRMGLLTVIVVGDGIITICRSVVTIVESPDAWNSQTIGIVTASATAIYAVFLIYFDWMRSPYLPKFRQQLWTLLHYPLHLALCLFVQGFTQLVIWTKIFDVFAHLDTSSVLLDDDKLLAKAKTKDVVDALEKLLTKFFKTYTPQYITTLNTAEAALKNISTIDDKLWAQAVKYSETQLEKDAPNEKQFQVLYDALNAMISAMQNAVLETFGINLVEEVDDDNQSKGIQQTDSDFESELNEKMWIRFELIFNYTYIAAGISLILMVTLAIISRTRPWSKWAIIRHTIFTLLGVGTSLIACLRYNEDQAANFQVSAWMLPTITLVWVIVLVLTHVRNPPPLFFKGSQSFWSKKREEGSYNYTMPSAGQTAYKGVPHSEVATSV
ncbi:bacterial low temperature requirement a [Fusarium heterosporum]|uniref:Bacterial low temperature requirement a n=1 Tax=Fusarium heterosporum TaxID=42747 RepID=A0A8H5WWQ9_FUSHE|nr:bacterial low temperature requirement a [Fusarium heterosporum]